MARRRYNAPITAAYTAAIVKVIKGEKNRFNLLKVKQMTKGTGKNSAVRQIWLTSLKYPSTIKLWLSKEGFRFEGVGNAPPSLSKHHAPQVGTWTGDLQNDTIAVLHALAAFLKMSVSFKPIGATGYKVTTFYGPSESKAPAKKAGTDKSDWIDIFDALKYGGTVFVNTTGVMGGSTGGMKEYRVGKRSHSKKWNRTSITLLPLDGYKGSKRTLIKSVMSNGEPFIQAAIGDMALDLKGLKPGSPPPKKGKKKALPKKPTAHSYAPSESAVLTFVQKSPGHFVSPSQVATALGGTITHAKAKLEFLTKKGEIQWEVFGGKYGVGADLWTPKPKKVPSKASSSSAGKTMAKSYRVKLYKYPGGNQKAVGALGPYARRRSAAIDAMALVLAAGVPRQDVIETGKKVPTKKKYGKSGKKLKGSSYTVPTTYSGVGKGGVAVKAEIVESDSSIKGFKNPRRRNARRRNAHWVKSVNQRNERMWMLGRNWVITERGGLTRPFYETYDIESGRSLRPAPFASLGEAKRGIETFMDNVRKRRRSRGRG